MKKIISYMLFALSITMLLSFGYTAQAAGESLTIENLDTELFDEILANCDNLDGDYAYCYDAVRVSSDVEITGTIAVTIPDVVGSAVYRVNTNANNADPDCITVELNDKCYYLSKVADPLFYEEGVIFNTEKLGVFMIVEYISEEEYKMLQSSISTYSSSTVYTFDGTTYNLSEGTLLDNEYATGYLFSDGRLIVTAFKKNGSAASDYPWYASKSSITKLSFDDSITFIGSEAFYEYSNITGALVLPSSCTQIYSYAFTGCEGFTGTLTIPNGVTDIYNYAFESCSGFTGDLILPDSLVWTGTYAFSRVGCDGDLVIGAALENVNAYAFSYCEFKGNLIFNNNIVKLISYMAFNSSGFTGDLVLPDSVTKIGPSCFMGNGFSSVTFGTSLIEIDSNAFYGCSNLKGNVTIPNSVTTMEYGIFEECYNLDGVLTLPDSITKINDNTFYHTKFKKIVGGNNITSIGTDAFLYEVKDADNNYTTPASPLFINVDSENSVLLDYDWSVANRKLSTNELIWTDENGNEYYDTDALVTWDISENEDGSVMAYLFDTDADTVGETVVLDGVGTTVDFKSRVYSDTQILDDATNGKFTINHRGFGYKDTYFIFYVAPWTLTQYRDNIKHFYITNTSNISFGNAKYLFYNLSNLESIDFSNTSFSNVTDMRNMFEGCSSLTTLDLSNFDTSKVTDMHYMFRSCSSLTTLDVSNFATSNVTTMAGMFSSCSSLIDLNISSFDTSKVTVMREMFDGCSSLTTLDLSNFNTSNVTAMYNMFGGCSSLTSLDVSSFNTNSVTDMFCMFLNCRSLTTLDVSNFDTSNVTSIQGMFSYCSSLATLDVSNFNTVNVINMSEMFKSCSSLTTLDLSNFDTSKVTNMSGMFKDCNSLTTLDVSNFDTSNVTDMSYMFKNCKLLTSLDLSSFDKSNVKTTQYMFQDCSKLETLDLSNFDTSNVTTMGNMFYGCNSLKSLNLSNFNTVNVTDMNGMFFKCNSLTSLDLSNFDTTKVTNMNDMFANCTSLTSLNVSKFNTSKVTKMGSMFKSCRSLTSLNLSNFDTSNVTKMDSMFGHCGSLITLDVSNFNTSNVTNIQQMFSGCTALDKIVLPINIGTCSISLPKTFYGYAADDTRPDKPQSYTVLPAADASTRLNYISGTKYVATEALLKDATNEDYFLGVEHTSFKRENIASINFITTSTLTLSTTVEDAVHGILDVSLIGDEGVFAYSKASSNEGLYDIYVVTKYDKIYTNANVDSGAKYLFKGLHNCHSITGLEYLDLSRSSTAEGMFSSYAPTSIELPSTYYAHSENVDDTGNSTSSTYSNNLKEVKNVSIPGAAKLEITITLQTESTSWDWVAVYPGDVTPTDTNYSEATVSNGKIGGSTKTTKTFTYNGDSVNIFFRTDGSGNKYYGYYAVVTAYDADNNVLGTTVSLPKKVLDLSNLNLPEGINTTDFFTDCSNLSELVTPSTNSVDSIALPITMYTWPDKTSYTVMPTTSGTSVVLHDSDVVPFILNTAGDLYGTIDATTKVLTITGTGTALDKKLYDVIGLDNSAAITGIVFNTNTVESICDEWCKDTSVSGALTLPESLVSIGNEAFYGLHSVNKITIGGTVTSIGTNAFYVDSVEKITTILRSSNTVATQYDWDGDNRFVCEYILNTSSDLFGKLNSDTGMLTVIGDGTDLDIPLHTALDDKATQVKGIEFQTTNLTVIGDNWCKDLKNIESTLNIPSGVVTIGAYAFYKCGFTGDLVIPNSVTTIGESAFSECSFDGTLTLGSGLKTIGANAFESCNFTGDLILPDGLNNIGSQAFMGCTDFNGNLTIPDSVTTIGDYAFAYCIKLRGQLVIPSGLTKISAGVFSNCICFTGQLFIPDKITEIGNDAFNNCINIRDIKIGTYKKVLDLYKDNSKLTSIGKNAFYSDYKILTSLDTKNSTAEGYDWAGSNRLFSGSTYTTYLNTAQDLTGTLNLSTGELVISGTGTNLDIPLVECIGMLPLSNFTWQTDTIETICDGWCSNEEYYIYQVEELNIYPNLSGSLILPNSIKSIGENAFLGCEGFSGKLGLPNSLVSIGARAFMGCEGLTGDLTIPDTVTSLGDYAFAYCSGLNGVLTISDSVTSIGDGAFGGCNNIKNIVIGSGVESILNTTFVCTIPFKDMMNQGSGESPLVTTPVDTVVTTSNKNVTSYDWAADMRNTTFIVDVPLSTAGDLMGHIDTSIGELSITGDGKDLDIPLPDVFDKTILGSIKTLNFEADNIETICNMWCMNPMLPNEEDSLIPNLAGTLNLPNTIKSIGMGAFSFCSGFTGDLVLPSNLVTIGVGAFGNCSGFTGKIVIPDSVTTILDQAFIGCNNITFIEIGNGVESIGVKAFACANFDPESEEGFVLVETPVPTRLKTRNEVALNYDWSSDMREVTYVIQKYTLNTAGDLFGYLDTDTGELSIEGTGVNLDKQLYSVLNTTEERTALKSLTFNTDTIENIGYEWLYNRHYNSDTKETEFYFPNLAGDLILPDNLKTIYKYAFYGNPGFTSSLVIPDTVTTIADYAFYGCNYLNGNLVIPNSVTTLGQYAFAYCFSFDGTLTLSSSLTEISTDAFAGCTGLRGDLVIPDGVTCIGSRAFGGFDSGSKMFENGTLTLPDSVITIKSDAFNYCRFTGTLKLPKELVTIGDRAFHWTSFNSIEFNDKLTTIGGDAFSDCGWLNMDSLIIPDSVTTIKYGAFRCININKFYIGKNVETLGTQVFEKSSNSKTKLYTKSQAVLDYDWAGDNRTVVPMNTFTIALPQEITLKPKYLDTDGSPVWYTSFNMEITGDFEDGSYGTFDKVQSFTIGSESGDTRTVTTNVKDTTVIEDGTLIVPVTFTAPNPNLQEEYSGEFKLETILHEVIPFAS